MAGVSLGAGVGMHLAARHPGRVRSLSPHSAWTEAAMAHDVSPVLGEIGVPSLITVGARDLVCSPRFAERINIVSPAPAGRGPDKAAWLMWCPRPGSFLRPSPF